MEVAISDVAYDAVEKTELTGIFFRCIWFAQISFKGNTHFGDLDSLMISARREIGTATSVDQMLKPSGLMDIIVHRASFLPDHKSISSCLDWAKKNWPALKGLVIASTREMSL